MAPNIAEQADAKTDQLGEEPFSLCEQIIKSKISPDDPLIVSSRKRIQDPVAISFGLSMINAKFGERTLQAYCGDDLSKQLDAVSYALIRTSLTAAKDAAMVGPGFLADYFVLSARKSGLEMFRRMIPDLRENPETILPEVAGLQFRLHWPFPKKLPDEPLSPGHKLWLSFFHNICYAAMKTIDGNTASQGSPRPAEGSPRTG